MPRSRLTLLAKPIRRLRRARGLKQREIAELCDIAVQTWSNWERGAAHPSRTLLKKVENALELTPDEHRALFGIPVDEIAQDAADYWTHPSSRVIRELLWLDRVRLDHLPPAAREGLERSVTRFREERLKLTESELLSLRYTIEAVIDRVERERAEAANASDGEAARAARRRSQ
ncbi:MAG: helix-turn-helix transcriptional regulator [Acidobacteriota bacterium]